MPTAIPFTRSPGRTLGVEVELQILDWKTHDLCSGARRLLHYLGKSSKLEHASIKPELFQSMIEINTAVCHSLAEVRRDLLNAFAQVRVAGEALGLEFACAGTHAFASHEDRVVYPSERFRYVLERNRHLARRLSIFGLHVHLGMPDGDSAIAMMNAVLPAAPFFLALSGSSPFWRGEDTGLVSTRTTVFESMPTAGTPPTFRTWADFERHAEVLTVSRSIDSLKDLWWDVRPSPVYGTLEVRICDALPTLSETVALVALMHAYVARCEDMRRGGHDFAPPPTWLVRENKWRATRWGVDAELVIDERGTVRKLRAELERMLVECEPYAQRLGCAAELRRIAAMADGGCSYRRQREVYRHTRSGAAVMQSLAHEFVSDEPVVWDRLPSGA
ncbi:MAG TPA: glutamate--cysteine ligase [Polyangiaceae bacterium]|nr:glutamate--cysteine ligase [Polyangiaceae bacterium]